MKRTLSNIALVALLLLLPAAAMGYDFAVDGIYYYVMNGNAIVTNNGQDGCYSGVVVIPETVSNGGMTYPVTTIGSEAFYGCRGLTEISLPNTISSIGKRAFCSCSGLTQITVPDAVTIIDQNVFYGCTGLRTAILGKSVTTIENDAFRECYGLAQINIPASVTSIGDYAFDSCTGIKTVIFEAVNCNDPIWFSAFTDSQLDSLILGYRVQRIPALLAAGQTKLKSIIIPKSVTSIGDFAFHGCSQLTNVTCLSTTPPALGNYGFFDSMDYYAHATLHVLADFLPAYQSAMHWKYFFQITGDAYEYILGDVNGDGEINISDANSMIEIIVNGGGSSGGHTRIPYGEGDIADVNGDGEVNIADLNAIIDIILRGH